MKKAFTWFLWLFLLFLCAQLFAQAPTEPTLPQCGIADITPEQARSLLQRANAALERRRTSGTPVTTITYVPIRPHIFRRSNGTGGLTMDALNQVLALTNSHYLLNNSGIQFYFAGSSPDYVDSDDYYAGFGSQSVDGRDATNALNQYYVNLFTNAGIGGYAYYPDNSLASTRSFIGTGILGTSVDDLGNRLIPHELGHNFNLIHTFGTSPTTELVSRGAGSNCSSAGDLICDTPADPYNIPGAYVSTATGCPQYDPNSTARDANGDAYSPLITNIMSYYFPCMHDFTSGQYDRMQAGLALRQSHTAYSLDAPPTNVVSPGNLSVSLNGLSATLTWQDNADNEMGYFIERSTSPTTGFVAIGGVGPNGTTYTDTKISTQAHYYYRIRPSNTTTGSLSPTVDVVVPNLATTLTGNTAQLNWSIAGSGTTYEVQWRAVGAATWTTISGLTNNVTYLNNLTSNTTYEWRVRFSGSSSYEGPVSFTIPCFVPIYPGSSPNRASAYLYWGNPTPNQSNTLRWRVTGSPDWTTISGLSFPNSSPSYSLTGLQAVTAYEWQVQSVCSPTASSDFTPIQSFTTLACATPYSLATYGVLSGSAQPYWSLNYYEPGRTSDLRYRAVGAADWIVIPGLTSTSYSLTGLVNNTQYEYQVRSICLPNQQSDYSTSALFTTSCSKPTSLYSSAKATSASLSWYINGSTETGGTYTLQYRPVGSPDWSLISGLSSFYSLTGLATNITYEWRVLYQCSASAQSDFSATATFTTRCNPATASNISTYFVTSSSVRFSYNVNNDLGTTYEIRYRSIGNPDWTTVSNLTASAGSYEYGAYDQTGLPNNTTFEWQFRAVCSASETSAYTTGPTFTTQCRIPQVLRAYSITVTEASLSWDQVGLNVIYDLRYRRVGSPDWTTLANLSDTYIALNELTTNTPFECQVRARCSDGQYSDYSPSVAFSTLQCVSPTSAGSYLLTENSASLYWYSTGAGSTTRTEIRYRAVGAADWTTVSILTTAQNGYFNYLLVSGLSPSTSYEWQIRTLCSPAESSAFSSSYNFQTREPCTLLTTLRSGNWSDTSVWSCGRVPTTSDVVHLKHSVTIPQNYQATAQRLLYEAPVSLKWTVGARLTLGQ